MFLKLCCVLLFPLATLALPAGHSHNDYEQEKPFELAARSGMVSLEADVFPIEGHLLVAHSRAGLNPARSLQKLYLEPWQRWGRPLELVVDIKAEPELALDLLEQEIENTPPPRQSLIVLSGLRPKRYPKLANMSLEGTVAEFRAGSLPGNCRYLSGPWWAESGWKGQEPLPTPTRTRLEELVRQIHSKGLLLRLWGTPDSPEAWEAFYQAGVDRINTDHPRQLGDWLKRKESR